MSAPNIPAFLREPQPGFCWVFRRTSDFDSPDCLACWKEVPIDQVPNMTTPTTSAPTPRTDAECQIPLTEILESIPVFARAWIGVGPGHERHIPFGRHSHDAAKLIRQLERELAAAKTALQREQEHGDRLVKEFEHIATLEPSIYIARIAFYARAAHAALRAEGRNGT
jgi:hypothetical protein